METLVFEVYRRWGYSLELTQMLVVCRYIRHTLTLSIEPSSHQPSNILFTTTLNTVLDPFKRL